MVCEEDAVMAVPMEATMMLSTSTSIPFPEIVEVNRKVRVRLNPMNLVTRMHSSDEEHENGFAPVALIGTVTPVKFAGPSLVTLAAGNMSLALVPVPLNTLYWTLVPAPSVPFHLNVRKVSVTFVAP